MTKKSILITTIFLFISFESLKLEAFRSDLRHEEPKEWDILIQALIIVESEGNQFAEGKTNDVGILQITPIYVKEVNRILNENVYLLSHRTDIEKSLEMFEIYQAHHNPTRDILRAIKIHNPGAGEWYTDKVINVFKSLLNDSKKLI